MSDPRMSVLEKEEEVLKTLFPKWPPRGKLPDFKKRAPIPGKDSPRLIASVAKSTLKSKEKPSDNPSRPSRDNSVTSVGRQQGERHRDEDLVRETKMIRRDDRSSKESSRSRDRSLSPLPQDLGTDRRANRAKDRVANRKQLLENLRSRRGADSARAALSTPKIADAPTPRKIRRLVRHAIDSKDDKKTTTTATTAPESELTEDYVKENFSSIIQGMFGRPGRKRQLVSDDEDDSDMEVSVSEMMKEEARSAKIARKEDAEEEERERREMEKKRQRRR